MRLFALASGACIALCLTVVTACGGKAKSPSEAPAPTPAPSGLNFQTDINPILQAKCSKCHAVNSTGEDAKGRIKFVDNETEFKNAGDAVSTKIQLTDDNVMPPPDSGIAPLTPDEKAKLLKFLGK